MSTRPDLFRAQRRFWLACSACQLLFAAGDSAQTLTAVRDPVPAHADAGTVESLFVLAGLLTLVMSMLLSTDQEGSERERLRSCLDAATVLIAGGVLAWWFASTAASKGTNLAVTTLTVALVLLAGFAAVKAALSTIAPMTKTAATPLLLSVSILALLSAGELGGPRVGTGPVGLTVRIIPALLVVAAPRIQEVQARSDPRVFARRPPRPRRLLPYVAVAVTFATLVTALPRTLDGTAWGMVVGAVLTTSAVVARQVVVLNDNRRLIRRMDTVLGELRVQQARLRGQATHDGLTQLLNRTAFVERVTAALADFGAGRAAFILVVDLDDFKSVNDRHGHVTGDALLVAVADRLRTSVRGDDVVARLGGDEFAILVRGIAGDDGDAIAARVLAAISQPIRVQDREISVRATIGIAQAGVDEDFDDVLRNADIAMYAAKEAGRNGFRRYTPDLKAHALEAARLAGMLAEAIESGEFHLLYQPIVTLRDRRTVGVEALVRWRRNGRTVPPAEFIPIAEQTGLIVPLGRWILQEACRQAAEWRRSSVTAERLILNVNVAGRQLQEPGFVEEVAGTLLAAGLPPGQLTIEVTETAVLGGPQIETTLAALRRLGVGLALDDFGTAASSLGLLLTCPVSTLKLDRSFVECVATMDRPAAVATAVVQMAKALNMEAVAEGVESPEQAAHLAGLGYQLAQGYLFGRPQPPDEITWNPVPDATTPRRICATVSAG